jgi:hypothetical protein
MSAKTNSTAPPSDLESSLSEALSRIVVTEDDDIAFANSTISSGGQSSKWTARFTVLTGPVSALHKKTPFLKRLPGFVLFPISILIVINCVVWAIVGIILRYHP